MHKNNQKENSPYSNDDNVIEKRNNNIKTWNL